MISVKSFAALLCVIALLALSNSVGAQAGQCVKDSRVLKVDAKQSVRFPELSCRLDRDATTSLRVQFQRFGESAAGVLLNNGKAPWTQQLYGKVRVLENPVLREYHALVKRFAAAVRYNRPSGEGTGVGLVVDGLDQPPVNESVAENASPGVVQTFELPLRLDGPLVDEILHILKQRTWPESLKLSYKHAEDSPPFLNLHAWRYLTRSDLDEMEARLKRYNALIGSGANRRVINVQRALEATQLLRYLTSDGLPEKFMHFSSTVSGDGCYAINFSLNWMKFDVDVALLHNSSQKPITIERFVGAETSSRALRITTSDDRTPSGESVLQTAALALQPGETLIVPLRLNFGPLETDRSSDGAQYEAEARATAEKIYQRIQTSKPGTVFKLIVETDLKSDQRRGKQPNTYEIVKTRESFTPHSEPEEHAYAFGPEWSLGAIDVMGERLNFTTRERVAIHFTVDGGAGSCPVLYSWSDPDSRWERHGKIIHKALGWANAQTETIRFDGWVSRFLISEEELEVSHLSGIRATVRLQDGSLLDLVAERSGSPVSPLSLYAGEEIEFRLALPDSIEPKTVVETRLIVNGYYDRYSAMLVSQMALEALEATEGIRDP